MEKPQLFFIVTLAVYILAALFFLCGFGGPNWISKGGYHEGLFKTCNPLGCGTIKLTHDATPDWFKATVALMILAFFGVIASGVSFLWMPITAICHLVTGGLTMLAIIVYGAEHPSFFDLDWSFALATLAALMFLANGAFLGFLALKNGFDMTRRRIPFLESDTPPS